LETAMKACRVTIFASTLAPFVVVAPLPAALAAPSQAQAAESLNGWGPFKFGMTPDRARALPAPGQAWKYTPPYHFPMSDNVSILSSEGPVTAFGDEFVRAGMSFETGKGLTSIYLHGEKKVPAEDCEKSFQALVTNLEARYGSFVPGYRLFEGAAVRQIPGSKSQYQYASGAFNGVTEWLDARRVIGGRYLDVSAVIGREARCSMNVNFRPDNPQGPNAPKYQRSE
jgi:hypothetical protein